MTNQALIQAKIWKGYAQAALRLGSPFNVYRPSAIKTLELEASGRFGNRFGGAILGSMSADWSGLGPVVLTLPVALNAEDMRFGKPNKYAKGTWYALVDGTQLAIGDYLVGSQGTFFIAALQPLLPILVVECNDTVSLFRVGPPTSVGVSTYSGATFANEIAYVAEVPCSILQGTKGEKAPDNLPGDTRSPWWNILMPRSVGDVRYGDLITDERGRRFVVSSSELTDLGYRLTAMMAMT